MYWVGVGGSCSMDNPWPVGPDPRGVGHLEALRSPGSGQLASDPRGVRSFGPDAGPQGRKRVLNPQGSSQRVPDDVAVRSLES